MSGNRIRFDVRAWSVDGPPDFVSFAGVIAAEAGAGRRSRPQPEERVASVEVPAQHHAEQGGDQKRRPPVADVGRGERGDAGGGHRHEGDQSAEEAIETGPRMAADTAAGVCRAGHRAPGVYARRVTHSVELRPSLRSAIESAVTALGGAGTWLAGPTVSAVLVATRHAEACPACEARRRALSPEADHGTHLAEGDLDPPLLDLVHRLRTDSGRLTERWAKGLLDSVGAGAVVEASGLVATLVVLDTLHDALGTPRLPLPPPSSDSPTGEEPAGLAHRHCWVPTVDPNAADGIAARLYGAGGMATVVEALTMSPHATALFWGLVSVMYIKPGTDETVGDTAGSLTLSDVELLAARISALNECFY